MGRFVRLALALALACGLPACSLMFDGSSYTGGGGGESDGGGADAGPVDAGPPRTCAGAADCNAGEYCDVGDDVCTPCDEDLDGFFAPECDPMGRLPDCDDEDPDVYPGARPICGNGVDDSCSDARLGPLGAFIAELGFLPVRQVRTPADPVAHLRVIARGPEDVVVLWQIDDGRSTPLMAEVQLIESSAAADPDPIHEFVASSDVPPGATAMAFDVVHDRMQRRSHVIVAGDVDGNGIGYTITDFPDSGGWSNVGGGTVASAGIAMGDRAALLGVEFLRELVVPGVESGVQGLYAIDLGSETIRRVSSEDASGRWASSDGQVAAFASSDGPNVLLYNGLPLSGTGDETRVLSFSTTPSGASSVYELRGPGGGSGYTVITPFPDRIGMLQLECSGDRAVAECAASAREASWVTQPTGPSAVGATPTSESSLGLLWGADDGRRLAFAPLETEPLADTIGSGLEFPAPGTGRIVEIAFDHQRDDEEGSLWMAYAYVRHEPASPPQIRVGGALVCMTE